MLETARDVQSPWPLERTADTLERYEAKRWSESGTGVGKG
jgi:hypothetical protein